MELSDEKRRVLIIEDDEEIASVVAMNLESIGLDTETVQDGQRGLRTALAGGFHLIMLDIMLPGMDGITICRKIRETDQDTPVLMLTAKDDEIDRVLGLELGADDYMTKPFSMRELLARVKALLRRVGRGHPPESDAGERAEEILHYGDIRIDMGKHQVLLKEGLLDLTVKEFELLSLFARNPGRAYSRADLLKLIWGYNFEGYEHTVNTHINRLRNKIERDPSHPEYLLTVWGIGYRFAEKNEASP